MVTIDNAEDLLRNEIAFRNQKAGVFPGGSLVIDTPVLKAVLAQFDAQPSASKPLDQRITQAPPSGPWTDRRPNGSTVSEGKTARGSNRLDKHKRPRSPSPTRRFSGQPQRPNLDTDFNHQAKRSRLSNTPTESPYRSATSSSEPYDRYEPSRDRGGGGPYWNSDRERWPPRND
jgi:hypothetical protein